MSDYLDENRAFPHCPGCGHPHVLRSLDGALTQVDLPKESVLLTTDIGCVGLADSLFPTTHTVHSLHGRSVAVATGLALGNHRKTADALSPIVLIGDGGVGIGLLHVIHAAQLNVNITVLVHNNLIYGMTGGQHSLLTPERMVTTTTPGGAPIPPLDLGSLLISAGATFFARVVAPGQEVQSTIAEAIRHPGFACVEILELCPTFATVKGGITGRDIQQMPEKRGLKTGVLHRDLERPHFLKSVPEGKPNAHQNLESGIEVNPKWRNLDRPVQIVIAGRAGERIQSAALLAGAAATAAGLEVTFRADNPVTQGSGFSLAELTISPEPVRYTGLIRPDLVLILAPEGQKEIEAQGLLKTQANFGKAVFDRELTPTPGIESKTVEYRKRFGAKNAALGSLMTEILSFGWWTNDAWESAISRLPDKPKEDARKVYDLCKNTSS